MFKMNFQPQLAILIMFLLIVDTYSAFSLSQEDVSAVKKQRQHNEIEVNLPCLGNDTFYVTFTRAIPSYFKLE